jgi:U3 small nucleolar RNA-associated protein 10
MEMQTLRVNLKALELAKKIQWEFYTSSSLVYDEVTADEMKVSFVLVAC